MKAVKKTNNILYVEVPNEMMLERVEKGIKCVYEQKVNIVVGVDLNPNTLAMCSNTKFIPIVLNNTPKPMVSKLSPSAKIFQPNHSEVTENDFQIRRFETEQWIQSNS